MDEKSGMEAAAAAATVESKEVPEHAGKVDPGRIAPAIEALLLSVDKAVSGHRLAQALGLIREDEERTLGEHVTEARGAGRRGSRRESPLAVVQAAVGVLNGQYESSGRSFRIEEVAGGYRVMTLAQFAPVLEAYHGRRERASLSRAAVETLAIVAYKQPLTRAGLEAIRGVACGEILRSLMDRRLITMVGRSEELGRPILYGTSKQFLEVFGLSSLKDLPSVEEFKQRGGGDGSDEEDGAAADGVADAGAEGSTG